MPDAPEPRRILIVRLSALGDVVHALPLLDALRRARPEAEIGWLVEEKAATLLRDHPQIDRLWVLPRAEIEPLVRRGRLVAAWRVLWRFMRELRAARYELAIDPQSNLRSSFATWLSGTPRRLGFARGWAKEGGHLFHTRRVVPRPERILKVQRNLELLRTLGIDAAGARPVLGLSESERAGARASIDALGGRPAVLIHPGVSGRGAIKRWEPERFGAVARRLGDEVGAKVLVSWGPGERELAETVVRASGDRARLGPETHSILELAALLEAADLVIGSDTGPLHLAGALGVATVGLYGPKDPDIYAPWDARTGEPAAVVRSPVHCSPCNRNRCTQPELICMPAIEVEDVVLAARAQLAALETDRAGGNPTVGRTA